MAKSGRPKIDLDQKVRELLGHTLPAVSPFDSPIRDFEERANAALSLVKYVDDHLSTQSIYQTVYDRHMSFLHRRILGRLIETFERFMKELAIVCVDAVADDVIDDRFDKFSASGGNLAASLSEASAAHKCTVYCSRTSNLPLASPTFPPGYQMTPRRLSTR